MIGRVKLGALWTALLEVGSGPRQAGSVLAPVLGVMLTMGMDARAQGWYCDPYGVHEDRYFLQARLPSLCVITDRSHTTLRRIAPCLTVS